MRGKSDIPVFVTGVERSGSSIIGQILHLCGAFGGDMSRMFENQKVRNIITRLYLEMGADPRGQYPLPNVSSLLIPADLKRQVLQTIYDEGCQDHRVWFLKGSRLSQTWPIWHWAFPSARWIIVRRRTGDILDSCERTGYMKAFDLEKNRQEIGAKDKREGWLWWIHQHERMFVDMIEAGVNCKMVWPERMVQGNYAQIYEMLEWVGLQWHSEIVKTVDPLLWKSRLKTTDNENNG